MRTLRSVHGVRIRDLLSQATDEATIIAPFIKVDAFRSLLRVVPPGGPTSLCHAMAPSRNSDGRI